MPLNTSYELKNCGIVFLSTVNQSLTRLVLMVEGSFDAVVKNDICLVVLMQDNVPCHTAKSAKTFLTEENITVIEWLAQSLDMNPIENVWKLPNERAKEKNPSNVEELWTNLKGEWEKISVDECKTFIHSCSKRCQSVIESKGLHIKYDWIMNAIFI